MLSSTLALFRGVKPLIPKVLHKQPWTFSKSLLFWMGLRNAETFMNYGPYDFYKMATAELRISHKNSQLPHIWQSHIFGYCFSILDKDTVLI